MANATWPAALPQALPLRSPIEPVDTRGRFEPDAGPAQVWSLETQPIEVVSVESRPMVMTSYQKGVLQAFVRDTLIGGALPFDWIDPWPDAGLFTFQFRTLPRYDPTTPARDIDGRPRQILYDVTFSLSHFPWLPPSQVG